MNQLKSYATSVAFQISFSQIQLEAIHHFYTVPTDPMGKCAHATSPGHISTWNALRRKGVMKWTNFTLKQAKNHGFSRAAKAGESGPGYWKLTEEGEALATFLDKIGMFDEIKKVRYRNAA